MQPSNVTKRGSMRSFFQANQRTTDWNKDYSQGWSPSRGAYSTRGYTRGGGRPTSVHRNRSLVLNANNPTSATLTENDPPARDDTEATASSAPGWVAKTGRHLQLINTSVYEKDTQIRAKAMEATRKQKLKQRDDREKTKLHKHIQRLGGGNTGGPTTHSAANYEIDVQGIRFRVTKNGSKLAKVEGESFAQDCPQKRRRSSHFTGDFNVAKSTPKTALVGGVRFYRTKNGNMYRSGIIKAHRYERPFHKSDVDATATWDDTDSVNTSNTGVVKKINEPCKAFSTTGSSCHSKAYFDSSHGRGGHFGFQLTQRYLGSCSKGPRCRYLHDPSKVAVCKEFLQKGSCPSGDSCDLSHELTPERTPACLHFARGNCSNANCHYNHVRVSPSAPVCRPFGIYGYCEKGANCEDRHVHECPDFSNTGKCTTKGCKLPHRHKASIMRITAEEGNSDVSSDEDDEEIDSDDVDSDDLNEEFFGDDDGTTDSDVPMQRDYVQFS
jgi:hypothetical protein